MMKIKDVLGYLDSYKKIARLTNGIIDEELDFFYEILKPYRSLELKEFERKVLSEKKNRKSKTLSRDEALNMGEVYYRWKSIGGLTAEEESNILLFINNVENKLLVSVLDASFDETYDLINKISDKNLTSNQLYFLGMALLNIRVKGSSKAIQKKNLLDILWSTIENKKMNEIYENVV